MKKNIITLDKVKQPLYDCTHKPLLLDDKTMSERKSNVLKKMHERNLDKLVIYCDVEHSGNFEYLVGFFTRFEEALLVMDRAGKCVLFLGNENLNKADKARIKNISVHVPYFSLPNQPMKNQESLSGILKNYFCKGEHIGVVGWKNFTSPVDDNRKLLDIPNFIVEAIRDSIGAEGIIENHTDLFIGENGVRTVNNANEIAHYEYGASLASDAMLEAMNTIKENISEIELGAVLNKDGQHNSVVTIAASGPRFIKGNMFPTDNKVKLCDAVSLTVGYKGGLSSRAGYAVYNKEDLPDNVNDYLQKVAIPYYMAYVEWLETIHIGMKGKDLYKRIDTVLPKDQYHWSLCPGHLTADEEWLSSPVYENSDEIIKSGMIFQIDIIPSVEGYAGISAESTVALADETLREKIKEEYPDLWKRIEKRRNYLKSELNIMISDEILPLCSTVAYVRPYLLNKEYALKKHNI